MSKISIKKLLIITLLVTVVLAISLFAVVSNMYVNEYFDEYIESTYETNKDNIVEFAKLTFTVGKQQRSILNSYIIEPIYYVEIIDDKGNQIMYSGGQGSKFMLDEDTMYIENYDVFNNGNIIGQVNIVRAKQASYTHTKQVFNRAIYIGALIAVALVLIVIGIIGAMIIRYIIRDTKKAVENALSDSINRTPSRINEFSQINNAINGYKERLALKEKVKKEKFDRILHETKTPITVLKSQLEGAADGIINIDKLRAQEMVEQVDKLDNTLKDATAVIEGNEIEEDIEIEEIDYSTHIEKIVSSMHTRFSKKGIELIYDKKPFVISTDKNLLDNVVYNLLMNGYKYTNEGSVTIETFDKELMITDTGIGISQDEIDKVFNPYFRGCNITDVKGEGLGLYNVKNNLDKLDIDISVESKISEYTQFKLVFK